VKTIINKYVVYACILIGEVFLIILLSNLIGVSTEGTLLGAIGVTVVFSTISAMLLEIAKTVRSRRPGISFFLYIIVIVLFAGIITNFVLLVFT